MDQRVAATLRSPGAWAYFLVPAITGLILDLWSKAFALRELTAGVITLPGGERALLKAEEFQFIPGYLHFLPHLNYGAVFGIGQGNRALFLVVSVIAIGLLGHLFTRSGKQRIYQVLLGMLLAGVIGNMYDRAVYGYVRDMIYALPSVIIAGRQVFPWIFNIADSLLCVGVGGMFIYSLFAKTEPKARKGLSTNFHE